MKRIKLTKGKYAIVDDEDFEYLNQWKWNISWNGYATRSQHIRLGVGKYTSKGVWMHRIINNTPKNLITDHINMNKLDNRRCNLRDADKSLNGINRGKNKNNTSGCKGVSWDSWTNMWRAELMIKGNKVRMGRFSKLEDAIKVRKEAELIHHII